MGITKLLDLLKMVPPGMTTRKPWSSPDGYPRLIDANGETVLTIYESQQKGDQFSAEDEDGRVELDALALEIMVAAKEAEVELVAMEIQRWRRKK